MAVSPNIFMLDIQTSGKPDAASRNGRQKAAAGADFGSLFSQRMQSGPKASPAAPFQRTEPTGRAAQDNRERSVERERNTKPSAGETRQKATEGARRPQEQDNEPQATGGNNLPPEAQALPVAGQMSLASPKGGTSGEGGVLLANQTGFAQSLQVTQEGLAVEEGLEGLGLEEQGLDLNLDGEALLKSESTSKLLDLATKGTASDFKLQLQSLNAATTLSAAGVREAQPPLTQYTTSVQVPFQDPKWGEQMVNKVLWLSSQSLKSAEIHLNPAELGPVKLEIQVHQDQATVQVQAQNASVREALELQVHRLREALANNGLGLAQFDVSAQSGQQQEQQAESSSQLHSTGSLAEAGEEDLASDQQILETGLPGLINTYV